MSLFIFPKEKKKKIGCFPSPAQPLSCRLNSLVRVVKDTGRQQACCSHSSIVPVPWARPCTPSFLRECVLGHRLCSGEQTPKGTAESQTLRVPGALGRADHRAGAQLTEEQTKLPAKAQATSRNS